MGAIARRGTSALAVAALAVAALAAVSCGGPDSTEGGAAWWAAEEPVTGVVFDDPDLAELVTDLATDVGVDAVFASVALAFDRGYSTTQLAAGAATDRVGADGLIADTDPADEPYGRLDAGSAIASLRRSPDEEVSVEQLAEAVAPVHDDFDWQTDLDTELHDDLALAGALVALVDMGYDFGQVVDGLIFGEMTVRLAIDREYYDSGSEPRAFGCVALVDGAGSVVVPVHERDGRDLVMPFRSELCGRRARNGQLLTAEQAAQVLRDETSTPAAPATTAPADRAATTTDGLAATHTLSAVLSYTESDEELLYQWSATFAVADDGDISGRGSIVGRSAGVCDVAGIEATTGEYGTYGEGSFDVAGHAVGEDLEIEFVNAAGQLTTREGDESLLCVDISLDVAEALFGLELGAAGAGGPIVVPVSGGNTSFEPPGWGVVIDVEVARL